MHIYPEATLEKDARLVQMPKRCIVILKLTHEIKRYTVSNKKTHLAVFETCVFRVYLWNYVLELQKSYFHLFASLSKEPSDEKIIFEIR